MRELEVSKITEAVRDLCISVNYELSADMCEALRAAKDTETSPVGREVLGQLDENLQIARDERIPICQDTGMAVVFLEIGQDVHLAGGDLTDAVNEGVRRGYEEGYLRKSVVGDPLLRVNTGDNTPAVIHTKIVPGEDVRVTVAPKGFGSENMSRVYMLKPADGIEGVKRAVVEAVREAGPNACPPVVVGVGIGGTFEKAALLAKEALLKKVNKGSAATATAAATTEDTAADIAADTAANTATEKTPRPSWIEELEGELLREINTSGLGPAGLGGSTTALAVNINTYATHIAGLPVAINICCHVNRHATRIL